MPASEVSPVYDRPDALESIAAVQARLSTSRQTVNRLIAAGEIQSVKIGRCRRIFRSSVSEYIERQKAASC